MRPADDFQQIRDGLFFWQGYDASVKVDLSCCALRIGEQLLFIDPIPLGREPLELLKNEAAPAAIILTNANHARAATEYKRKFAIPIYAHSDARGEVTADYWLEDEAQIFKELNIVKLSGAPRGEIAICSPGHGVTMLGDALINLEPHGFALLPEKYCADAKEMKQSLRKLLQWPFDVMTFAHGLPIVTGAQHRLEQLLQT